MVLVISTTLLGTIVMMLILIMILAYMFMYTYGNTANNMYTCVFTYICVYLSTNEKIISNNIRHTYNPASNDVVRATMDDVMRISANQAWRSLGFALLHRMVCPAHTAVLDTSPCRGEQRSRYVIIMVGSISLLLHMIFEGYVIIIGQYLAFVRAIGDRVEIACCSVHI